MANAGGKRARRMERLGQDKPQKQGDAPPVRARTEAQGQYIASIIRNQLTFGVGPAGTGKTFICGALAADALRSKRVRKLFVTRPAVEAGESLGFLPGELDEKYEPYLRPFRDVFLKRMKRGEYDYMMRSGEIEAMPLAYMRGMTFEDCWVILDEAQNTTPLQMKLFLSRIGENCKVIVNGDPTQKDIRGESGLVDAVRRLEGLPFVGFCGFERADIVRSGLAQQVIERYET